MGTAQECSPTREITNMIRDARRVVKMAVQQGRSERRGESYSEPYVEALSDTKTPLAAFFNTLLVSGRKARDIQKSRRGRSSAG